MNIGQKMEHEMLSETSPSKSVYEDYKIEPQHHKTILIM
jgi:hypothetical protein